MQLALSWRSQHWTSAALHWLWDGFRVTGLEIDVAATSKDRALHRLLATWQRSTSTSCLGANRCRDGSMIPQPFKPTNPETCGDSKSMPHPASSSPSSARQPLSR